MDGLSATAPTSLQIRDVVNASQDTSPYLAGSDSNFDSTGRAQGNVEAADRYQ